jgi:hypothetical protein
MNWETFWTAAPNHKNITKTITLESTSDTQEDLDLAANERERSDQKPSFRYTEMRPTIPEQDGTIEHGDPRVVTDIPDPEISDVPVVHPLSRELETAALENFQM